MDADLGPGDAGSCAATYLISIAGSAGAFDPLVRLLSSLPSSLPAAVVALIHAGPSSCLAEALSLRLPPWLRVVRAFTQTTLTAGHVYVSHGGSHLVINPDARLSLAARSRSKYRPSADWLFESAAASFMDRHVSVVLSGLLSDGARRLGNVRRSGGTVLAQHPCDALYPDMPRAAIATGFVNAVADPRAMAEMIVQLLRDRNPGVDRSKWENPFDARRG
jgi:chemotaxis response regulator CheB